MTKIATYFEAIALEALLKSKGVPMGKFNLGNIVALLSALAPVIAAGGPVADELIKAFGVAEPILVQSGIIPPGIAAIASQLAADYSGYEAGQAVTVGPFPLAVFGTLDDLSLIVKKH